MCSGKHSEAIGGGGVMTMSRGIVLVRQGRLKDVAGVTTVNYVICCQILEDQCQQDEMGEWRRRSIVLTGSALQLWSCHLGDCDGRGSHVLVSGSPVSSAEITGCKGLLLYLFHIPRNPDSCLGSQRSVPQKSSSSFRIALKRTRSSGPT